MTHGGQLDNPVLVVVRDWVIRTEIFVVAFAFVLAIEPFVTAENHDHLSARNWQTAKRSLYRELLL